MCLLTTKEERVNRDVTEPARHTSTYGSTPRHSSASARRTASTPRRSSTGARRSTSRVRFSESYESPKYRDSYELVKPRYRDSYEGPRARSRSREGPGRTSDPVVYQRRSGIL
ncbi:hypothetical protein LTR28_012505, partial [Elasticomyces elasticus]